jgi:hypothetical protein
MVLHSESKYSNRRAYVLKLRSDAAPGSLAGRIENLVTGRQREFASAEELLKVLAADLVLAAEDGAADT